MLGSCTGAFSRGKHNSPELRQKMDTFSVAVRNLHRCLQAAWKAILLPWKAFIEIRPSEKVQTCDFLLLPSRCRVALDSNCNCKVEVKPLQILQLSSDLIRQGVLPRDTQVLWNQVTIVQFHISSCSFKRKEMCWSLKIVITFNCTSV